MRALALLSLLGGLPTCLYAQRSPLVRQWQEAHAYICPAAIALSDEQRILGLYSYEERQSSLYGAMTDLPISLLGREHGIGAGVMNSTRGLTSDTEFAARYAWLQELLGGRLQIGLEGVLARTAFDGARALEEGITDPQLPTTKVEGKAFDLGLGLYWRGAGLSIGLSAQHLLGAEVYLTDRYQLHLPRSYSASISYRLGQVSTGLSWEGSLLGIYHEGGGYRGDLGLRAWWRGRFVLGAVYRWDRAVGIQIGASLSRLYLGYQGELSTQHRGQLHHELLISYSFPLSRQRGKPQHYKSVRLL
jgi:bacteroidetes-specific putative membrane protein